MTQIQVTRMMAQRLRYAYKSLSVKKNHEDSI